MPPLWLFYSVLGLLHVRPLTLSWLYGIFLMTVLDSVIDLITHLVRSLLCDCVSCQTRNTHFLEHYFLCDRLLSCQRCHTCNTYRISTSPTWFYFNLNRRCRQRSNTHFAVQLLLHDSVFDCHCCQMYNTRLALRALLRNSVLFRQCCQTCNRYVLRCANSLSWL